VSLSKICFLITNHYAKIANASQKTVFKKSTGLAKNN
jgi:hypothetical protein